MANLTVSIDDDLLRRARVRAAERGESVNAAVAAYLEQYAGPSPAAGALARFLDLAATTDAGSGPGGRRWTRDELHDRPNLR
jgi:plasmid stability protein